MRIICSKLPEWNLGHYVERPATSWKWLDYADGREAGFMSPDGTPEQAYFTEKLNNNLAALEGWTDITNGHFYNSSSTSIWYYGFQLGKD